MMAKCLQFLVFFAAMLSFVLICAFVICRLIHISMLFDFEIAVVVILMCAMNALMWTMRKHLKPRSKI
jgi:hypothetical protein